MVKAALLTELLEIATFCVVALVELHTTVPE